MDKTLLAKVRDCITAGRKFVLTTHVNPDGDGLGCEAALAAWLTDLGKDVHIFNSSPVPANYRFIDPDKLMMVYNRDLHREILLSADYIMILDISDWKRLRELGEDARGAAVPKICIDHHPPQDKFVDIKLVDTSACATGEIVYDLLKFAGAKITRRIAEALYTSIITDTGSFRFSNTNIRSFRICGELVEIGISPQRIYQNVYEHQPLSKIRLFAHALNHLKLEDKGRVAWFDITKEVLVEKGANTYDTEGFSDYPRVINGVEVSIMFIEMDEGKFKVSLRSRGNYVINGIAQKYGGGGHPYAAGIMIEGNMKEYIPRILEEVSYLFND
ncbi:MAG TPA: bifunctional oligoribonuclease/PAP phosphatase NrnA [bacterium]